MDVGQDTTLGDGDVSEKLVQLLIVPDGELQVAGNDTGLLVIAGGVASQFEDFGGQVLENSGQVDGRTGTDTLSVVALTEKTVDTADGERETSLRRTTIKILANYRLTRLAPKVGFSKPKTMNTRANDVKGTYDCAFLEPLALPPDLPPPVILMDVCEEKSGK